ncbi:DivIVA domain-containing protein [Micromonospora sp. NPDC049523]|uniref:DivIVA domain-containing protein n=1 Tax=Micromonospora sp. NPDC049523 TaxID=3155921 RepID=UPI003449641D
MRTFLRRLFASRSRPPTPTPTTSTPPTPRPDTDPFHRNSRASTYRSTAQLPLRPWHVRNQRFHPTRLGRRGLDPAEVNVFLNRVADDLQRVYAELAASRDENVRIKTALRQWQSTQAPRPRDLARHR